MTKLNETQTAALDQFAQAFKENLALEGSVRERHERVIQKEIGMSRTALEKLARETRDLGVPITRMVKAIDRKGDKIVRDLLAAPVAEDEGPRDSDRLVRPAQFSLHEGLIRISLAAGAYPEIPVDPEDKDLWTGEYTPFVRGDGKVLIDPTDETDNARRLAAGLPEHAVSSWLNNRDNAVRVAEWYLGQRIAA